jgi:hypothetical protein
MPQTYLAVGVKSDGAQVTKGSRRFGSTVEVDDRGLLASRGFGTQGGRDLRAPALTDLHAILGEERPDIDSGFAGVGLLAHEQAPFFLRMM